MIKHDTAAAIEFLKRRPGAIMSLSCSHVNPITYKKDLFETKSWRAPYPWAQVADWIETRQGRGNLYWSVNEPRYLMDKKAERTDIARVWSFHVDLDPRVDETQDEAFKRLLPKLQNYRLKPSIIIASGGGLQGIWNLTAPIEMDGTLAMAEDIALYNVQIERDLGGDSCSNLDRILRIPGTINVADEKKRRKGRVDALALMVAYISE
jgi:hypothetical protein